MANTVDPLGGSYYVEALTDELEARARELIARVDELGGAVEAIEAGWVQGEIEAPAYAWTTAVEAGERPIVGVNAFAEEEGEAIELHRLDPEAEQRQVERTRAFAPARRRRCRARPRARERGGAREREHAPAAPEALARGVRSARSAACSARSGARTTPRAGVRARRVQARGRRAISRPGRLPARLAFRRFAGAVVAIRDRSQGPAHDGTGRVRILLVSQMYPGPADPDLGVVRRAARARAARARPRARARGDRSPRRAGSSGTSTCGAGSRAAAPPDVVWAHFLVPSGLLAASVEAPLVVTAHGRDVRNVGEIPGIAALTRRVVRRATTVIAVSDYLRRELELKVPDARGKTDVIDSGVDLERFRPDAERRRVTRRERPARSSPSGA